MSQQKDDQSAIHVTKALFPAKGVAPWMTVRRLGEILPDATLRANDWLANYLTDVEVIVNRYYDLLERRNLDGKKGRKKLNDEEKEEFKKLEEIKKKINPETVYAGYFNGLIGFKESTSPSENGLRADQGFKIRMAREGNIVRKKARGILGRIRRRKQEQESVPVQTQITEE